ncbi:hypothetical protein LF826_03530 [Citrobacter freundii]|nr:hypothetical protein [Citrobacter freundii]MCO5615836.1 hypothetical protein [Citrobacter freundii]MCO5632045.1 hypothetical protein [Citrobacter freundii]MCO5646585.1 hypothetical protein [Citrobacter freundii]
MYLRMRPLQNATCWAQLTGNVTRLCCTAIAAGYRYANALGQAGITA